MWNTNVNDSEWHLRKNQVVCWTLPWQTRSLRKYHLAQYLHANATLLSIQGTRGETSFLCFAFYGFLADVLQNTYHMLLRYSRSYLSSSGMCSTCGLSHDWATERRSVSSLRRGSHLFFFAMFLEIVEDDVGAVCDPYHCRVPPYTPPSGSSTYGSVKTYTGHRPRIIFRSRTREWRMCVRAEFSVPITGENNLSCCEKRHGEKSRSAVAPVSAKLKGQSQSRNEFPKRCLQRLTRFWKVAQHVSFNGHRKVSYFSAGPKYLL